MSTTEKKKQKIKERNIIETELSIDEESQKMSSSVASVVVCRKKRNCQWQNIDILIHLLINNGNQDILSQSVMEQGPILCLV